LTEIFCDAAVGFILFQTHGAVVEKLRSQALFPSLHVRYISQAANVGTLVMSFAFTHAVRFNNLEVSSGWHLP